VPGPGNQPTNLTATNGGVSLIVAQAGVVAGLRTIWSKSLSDPLPRAGDLFFVAAPGGSGQPSLTAPMRGINLKIAQ
jgi:hypothetical protein